MIRENEILIGDKMSPILRIDNASILSCHCNLACSLTGEELVVDTLECVFEYRKLNYLFCPADFSDGIESAEKEAVVCRSGSIQALEEIPYATPVWYYNGGNYVGKFYVSAIKRTGKKTFRLDAVSAIGILDSHTYYGRMYDRVSVADAISNIILGDGLQTTSTPFMVDLDASIVYAPGVGSIAVTGWIPVCSKREALHYILFAHNLTLRRTDDDTLMVTWLLDSDSPQIPDDAIYQDGSVTLPDPAQRVEVTEHSFRHLPVDEVELFDNTALTTAGLTVVTFRDAPIVTSTLKKTGLLQIVASCPNAALVSGVGTLRGVPYTHNTIVISRGADEERNGTTVTCTDNTLVCLNNSEAVADKLWSYYTERRESEQDVVLDGQLPGRKFRFTNPFGDAVEGYISQMVIDTGGILKARCSIVSGYEPPSGGGFMSNAVLLTGKGTWTVPAEVFRKDNPTLRVVLVGGGGGGESGLKGPNGRAYTTVPSSYPYTAGGANGKSGTPGRVYQFAIGVDALQQSYEYDCGLGGAGAEGNCVDETTPNLGKPGTATTFGSFSSDSGVVLPDGVKNFFNGDTYASAYDNSIEAKCLGAYTGGGVYVVPIDPSSMSIWDADKGAYQTFAGRPTPEDWLKRHYVSGGGYIDLSRGCNGGSAAGENGVNLGTVGSHGYVINASTLYSRTGGGGAGADATRVPSNPLKLSAGNYGWGGLGGFGGGAGGSSGYGPGGVSLEPGSLGIGGRGGPGGEGAPGCIIIYY